MPSLVGMETGQSKGWSQKIRVGWEVCMGSVQLLIDWDTVLDTEKKIILSIIFYCSLIIVTPITPESFKITVLFCKY